MSATWVRVGRAERSRSTSVVTRRPVTVEILVESRLERLQREARSRQHGTLRKEVAVAVDGPHDVLIDGAVLPDDLIAAATLLRADRRPGTELARRDERAGHPELRTERSCRSATGHRRSQRWPTSSTRRTRSTVLGVIPPPLRSWLKPGSSDCNSALPASQHALCERKLPLPSTVQMTNWLGPVLPHDLVDAVDLLRADRRPGTPNWPATTGEPPKLRVTEPTM